LIRKWFRRLVRIEGGPTTFVSAHAGHHLQRLKKLGIFPDNPDKAKKRIKDACMAGIFAS
jgi:hypothetical protein